MISIALLVATLANPMDAVQATWAELDAAWNARDAEAFAEVFTEDATFRFVDRGQVLDTRTVMIEYFSERFPELSPALEHRATIKEVHAVADQVAATDGIVEILVHRDDGAAEVAQRFWIMAIMRQSGDSWLIHALRVVQQP